MTQLWTKTGTAQFETRWGVLTARLVRTSLLDALRLVRYEYSLNEHFWVVETARHNRPSLFDAVAWRYFTGKYLDFAVWVAEQGQADGDFPGVYVHRLDEDATVVVDPMNEGLVELSFFIHSEQYFVTVTPHTPVGLLARLSMEVRRNAKARRAG